MKYKVSIIIPVYKVEKYLRKALDSVVNQTLKDIEIICINDCSPDNSACEGFFGRMKNEMFYGYSWQDISIDQFIATVDEYMHWYAEKRVKVSLGGLSPLEYRRKLGIAV